MRLRGLLVLALLATGGLAPAPVAAHAAEPTYSNPAYPNPAYSNPVSAGTVDTFPDPAVIRGKDGLWYAYGTTNPILNSAGETGEHILPVISSADLVTWTYRDDVIALDAKPGYWAGTTRAWAPDIRYVNGEYYLTYSLSNGGIALLTSANPLGPWTDHGLLVPASGNGCPSGTIDQALFTDSDGSHYLYWGSYDTICVQRLNADATALVGDVTQVARGRRAEGAFVVHRGGWYYLLYSDAGCCDGAYSGYTVKVGRSASPLGPFSAPSGAGLMDLTSKDGIVLTANGDRWIGPGHNSLVTDLAGQDWLVYHAIAADDPDFPPVTGANGATLRLTKRPLMIDRLDWINGWPVVRAGAGPSNSPQVAPVTTPAVTVPAGSALSRQTVSGDVRVEGELRDGAGLVIAYADRNNTVVARLDKGTNRLVLEVTVRGVRTQAGVDLPQGFDHGSRHNVAAERRGRALTVEVSADRLRDAVGTVAITLPASALFSGKIGAEGDAVGVGAARLYRPVTARVVDPVPGVVLPQHSDEFDGADPAWSWVRGGSANAVVNSGNLVWPTQNAELYLSTNTASVLLRDAPSGDFTVETKLTFDGTRGNQQAGLLLYQNDDRWFKLAHSVLPLAGTSEVLHVTEFGKEGERPTTAPPTAVANAPMFVGPAAPTTWLRLRYAYDAIADEDEVRAATSVDGVNWTWGGVWTLPHTGTYRIGMISMNASGATGTFDYLRAYRG
ncbi:family 43 glycosylhydrolase [Actinoplanes sp. CA-015351]|uniref:family 43 glycosylhydrolase n=1 Tax=Actinoplanes sp. CA-015351 TaxID=3239897 RepID=UPI003D957C7B